MVSGFRPASSATRRSSRPSVAETCRSSSARSSVRRYDASSSSPPGTQAEGIAPSHRRKRRSPGRTIRFVDDRTTYFYSSTGKYWYDLQANITRQARDHAERLHQEDVWAEILKRLSGQAKARAHFAGVHIGPEDHGDVPDTDEVRLVVMHPKFV